MRTIDQLLVAIRRLSKNENYNQNGSEGIVDEQFVQALNDAQDYLQSEINAANPANKIFQQESIISVVANQEAYTIPQRVFYNKEIELVEYSPDGALANYVPLRKYQNFNRGTYTSDWFSGYYVRNGQICIVPTPQTSVGSLRVTYEAKLDNLDRTRGVVSVVTGLTSTTFTSLTVDSTADEVSTPNLSTIDYICINSIDGVVKVRNIPVLSYNPGTNILTPRVGYTFTTGETFAAGDVITFGKNTTQLSKLMDECEPFLVHYAVEAILHADSSDDVIKESAILSRILNGITSVMSQQTGEVQPVPETLFDEWW